MGKRILHMRRTSRTPFILLAVTALLFIPRGLTPARDSAGELERGFKDPPDSAKPRAWWHWLNGNITKEGITADLEWMRQAGIAGMQMFDGNLGTPVFVENRLAWMTPEWKAALRHAADEAARLRMEMAMAAAGGWSETGGPWVKPEAAMKKIVWSETLVYGPMRFSSALPHPPTNNGRFQDMGMPMELANPAPKGMPGARLQTPEPPQPSPTFYADSKVIAYRLLIKDSIEEKIRALQKQKKGLAEDVLGEEKFSQSLNLDDLRYLLAE